MKLKTWQKDFLWGVVTGTCSLTFLFLIGNYYNIDAINHFIILLFRSYLFIFSALFFVIGIPGVGPFISFVIIPILLLGSLGVIIGWIYRKIKVKK